MYTGGCRHFVVFTLLLLKYCDQQGQIVKSRKTELTLTCEHRVSSSGWTGGEKKTKNISQTNRLTIPLHTDHQTEDQPAGVTSSTQHRCVALVSLKFCTSSQRCQLSSHFVTLNFIFYIYIYIQNFKKVFGLSWSWLTFYLKLH